MKAKVLSLLAFGVAVFLGVGLFWPGSDGPNDVQGNGDGESGVDSKESEDLADLENRFVPTTPPPLAKTEGDNFLDYALRMLETRTSIEASIGLEINMAGTTLSGDGAYAEFWREDSTRYEFDRMFLRWEMFLRYTDPEEAARPQNAAPSADEEEGDEEAYEPELYALLRVRDPAYVWEYRKFGPQEECVRLDLVRIAQTLEEANFSPTPNQINSWPELGGLHRLLKEFRRYYEFGDMVESGALPGSTPELIYILKGRIREKRAEEADFALGPIPRPDYISIAFGRENYFPYRIEFLSDDSPSPGGRTSKVEVEPRSPRSLLVVEFREVSLDGAISADRFSFSPASMPSTNPHGPRFVDKTDDFLRENGLLRE